MGKNKCFGLFLFLKLKSMVVGLLRGEDAGTVPLQSRNTQIAKGEESVNEKWSKKDRFIPRI